LAQAQNFLPDIKLSPSFLHVPPIKSPAPSVERLSSNFTCGPLPSSGRLLIDAELGHRYIIEPSTGRIDYGLAKPKPTLNFSAATPPTPIPDELNRARKFKELLRSLNGQKTICLAVAKLFDNQVDANACESESSTNHSNTVRFTVRSIETISGYYEIELFGKSSELVVRSPVWVERHRFFVALGFNANLEPNVVVVNFEPMFKTTSLLDPEQKELFEYIKVDYDSPLRGLQDRIRNAISNAILSAGNNVAGAK
jgi:hypothetical protein